MSFSNPLFLRILVNISFLWITRSPTHVVPVSANDRHADPGRVCEPTLYCATPLLEKHKISKPQKLLPCRRRKPRRPGGRCLWVGAGAAAGPRWGLGPWCSSGTFPGPGLGAGAAAATRGPDWRPSWRRSPPLASHRRT